jgi:hypothetical protein
MLHESTNYCNMCCFPKLWNENENMEDPEIEEPVNMLTPKQNNISI